MRIDEAVGDEPKPLDVKFGTAVLHCMYRPANYTIAELERRSATKDVGTVITMIQEMLVSWDLTDTDGVTPIDIQNTEQMKEKVGLVILRGILTAIREDSDPSGEA